MKNIAAIALFLVATFFATGNATAQDHKVLATIPFAFTVGTQTMPPGTYTISSLMNSTGVLSISSWKGGRTFIMGSPNQDNRDQANKLVFHKYGDQYFLSQVRAVGSSLNVNLPTSKAEQKARTQTEDASLPVHEGVMVALK